MRAFVGTVPFTIIEAVHFVIANNYDDADLYMVKVFDGAEDVCERVRQTGVFKNVYLVEDVLLTYPITIEKCIRTVKNGKAFLKSTRNRIYDEVYYNNSGWLINSIFYTAFSRANKNIKNKFLEHGFNSYTTVYSDKPFYLRVLIRLVGLKCMDGTMLDEIHMFHPELMHMKHYGRIVKMTPMDRKNTRLVEALNHIFNYHPETDEFADRDIIIMEQGPQKFTFDKEGFWKMVLKNIDKQKTIIKPHPRQKNSTLGENGIKISTNYTLPWEVEILNIDIEKKTQITIFSGACVSPKLIFDEEPTVIFLYKILPLDSSVWGKDFIEFANQLGATYRNKEKFFVPESYEEYEEYCRKHGLEPAF